MMQYRIEKVVTPRCVKCGALILGDAALVVSSDEPEFASGDLLHEKCTGMNSKKLTPQSPGGNAAR